MAGLFAAKKATTSQPVATSLRVQRSLQGVPRPIVWGQTRLAGNVTDYAGFTATPQKSPGSKGGLAHSSGKGNTGQYTYSASVIVSLGEAINSVLTIYDGTGVDLLVTPPAAILAQYAAVNIVPSYGNSLYNCDFYTGTATQTADGPWAAAYGSHSLAYRGEAYVTFMNLGLGSSPSVPNFNFEVLGVINSDIPALGPDANPADVINDILTNATYGVPGFPSNAIGDFNTARNYWRATGLLISDALVDGSSAQSYLGSLMQALNADFRWSGNVLDIVPYGDVTVSGNGYLYTPNLTPVYAFGVNNFLPNRGSLGSGASSGTEAVSFERKAAADVLNKIQVEYLDRINLYNPVTIFGTNDAMIAATGRLRISDLRTHHFFALASAASVSVALQVAQEATEMVQYQFTVGRQYCLLDPLDPISLTEPALQLVNQLCRVIEIQENDDKTLTITAIEIPGTAGAPVYGRQINSGIGRNNNAPASSVNAPIFYEPPDQLGGGNVLYIGLSGQVASAFGGCEVWMSVDGGENYGLLGTFEGASRMGVTTSAITAVTASTSGVTIDSTNTLGVNVAESGATLQSASPSALAAFATAFVVGSEVLAYETATLTGANAYNLSILGRGGYGSTIASHASGAPFLRLDGNVFEWQFPSSYINKTLQFKFLAFNPMGGGGQSLANVGSYPYTVTGAALASPLPNVTNVYSNYEAGFQKIYWDEITDFRSGIVYEIRQGSSWAGAITVTAQAHPPFIARGNGTYWIAARCNPIAGLTVYSSTPVSTNATLNQLTGNVIKSYDEQAAGWPGVLQSGIGVSGTGSSAILRLPGAGSILADSNILSEPDILNLGGIPTNTPFYYTSKQIIDAGYVTQAAINANMLFTGTPVGQNVLSISNVLGTPDILGAASAAYVNGWVEINVASNVNDAFAATDEFSVSDAFVGAYIWGGWQKFVPGVFSGRAFQFRLALESSDPTTIAVALAFSWNVQVPNRIDHYAGITVPATGLVLSFAPDGAAGPGSFNGGPSGQALPYITVTNPQGQTGDTFTISNLTTSGLTIQFFNAAGVPVARSGVNVDASGF